LAIIFGFVLTAMASTSSYSQGVPDARSRIPRGPSVAYHTDFTGWEDDHLHWPAPSSVDCYTDGNCIVKAAHLANMKRTGDLQDAGFQRKFVVNLKLLDSNDKVVWADHIILDVLSYKYERDNVIRSQKFAGADVFFNKGYQMRIDREILSEGAFPVASIPYSP
jgi:hypothetical protein